jgi:hypothetical protein
MKLLRTILIVYTLFSIQYKVYATYFLYEVKVNETTITVTVRPDFRYLSPSQYCKWKFAWQYYNGIKPLTKEVAAADIYTYSETFVYPIDDQFISVGTFGDGISLDLTTYYSSGNCTNFTTVNDYEYVQQDLGTTTILATLDYSPKYPDGVPKNTAINFNYIFSPGSNTNLDHLKYYILINGSPVNNGGSIYPADFGQLKSWTYSGFPTPASYTAQIQIKRFGLEVGLSDPISIIVKADPPPQPPPIAQCVSGLNPALQVDATVNNDKVDLTFKDNSSSTFKTTFGSKSKYALLVTDADNIGYIVAGGKSINDYIYYPVGGFTTLTRTYNLSSIIKPSYTFTINFLTQCKDASGAVQTRSDPKTISVPGKPFNPSTENLVNIPPEGKLNQNVDIRAGYCKTLLIDQPDNQLDNTTWVSNINLAGNFLTFDVAPNYETYERSMGIKVFVNGYYDPCLAIEDGFTKTYRNITVTQASIFKDISSPSNELLSLPFNNPNVEYYSTQDYGNPKIAGYFLNDFPLQTVDWHSSVNSINKIIGYNSNNKPIWQANLHFNLYTCDFGDIGTITTANLNYTPTDYYGLIIHTPDKINIVGAYEKGIVYVTAGNQIIFKEGFNAKAGSILRASIQSCSSLKSAPIKGDSTNILNDNILESYESKKVNAIQAVSQISVYPNPNEGKFNIDMRNLKENVIRIEIYNSAGAIQKVLNKGIKTIETIDMNKAPSDTYFIKIISEKSIYNDKIIIL